MASETTTEMLRAAIETALRRRDPKAYARCGKSWNTSDYIAACGMRDVSMVNGGATAEDALRPLAVACGLRIDPCPACNGRGRRAYGREVEDGCDECECSGVVVVDPAEEVERLTMALDRAHHAVREHGPRCSHPECDALAPLRCDDCGRRFCDEHDDGLAGHDPGFGPQAHAVGPDDLMAGAAMRAAVAR